MDAQKLLTWQFFTFLIYKGVKKVEKFFSDICIYEYNSIYSHV